MVKCWNYNNSICKIGNKEITGQKMQNSDRTYSCSPHCRALHISVFNEFGNKRKNPIKVELTCCNGIIECK